MRTKISQFDIDPVVTQQPQTPPQPAPMGSGGQEGANQGSADSTGQDIKNYTEKEGYRTVILLGQSKADEGIILIWPSAEDFTSKMATFSDHKPAFEFLKTQLDQYLKISAQMAKDSEPK
jgi:hypothetical protein